MSAARIAGLGSGLLVLCAARAWAADARCPPSFAKASGACDERVSVGCARVHVSGGQVLVRAEHAVQWRADAAGRAALALSGGAEGRLPERRASAGRRLYVTGQDLLVWQLRVARVHVRRAESGLVHFGRHRAAAQHGRRWRRPRPAAPDGPAPTSPATARQRHRVRAAPAVENLSCPPDLRLHGTQPGRGAGAWRNGATGVRLHPALPGVASRAHRFRSGRQVARWLAKGRFSCASAGIPSAAPAHGM